MHKNNCTHKHSQYPLPYMNIPDYPLFNDSMITVY